MVTAEDLAGSIGRVGFAAKQAGISLEELQGYTTAMVTGTGITGDEAGTALKSVISRLFRIGSEGESDAGKSEKMLKGLGIAVRESNNQFRNFDDILKDISKKWSTWGNITQQNVSQTIGGTYHYSKFIALMENMDIATSATNKALNAHGSALEEQKKHMESIEGKMGTLKATSEGLWQSFIRSDAIKGLITSLTKLLEVVVYLNDELKILKPLIIGVGVAFAAWGAVAGIKALIVAIPVAVAAIKTFVVGMVGLKAAVIAGGAALAPWLVLLGGLTAGIIFLVAKLKKAKQETDEFTKTLEVQTRTYKELNEERKKYAEESEEYTKSEEKNVLLARKLTEELYKLDSVTEKTALQKQQMKNIVEKLNELIPDFTIMINEETGALETNRSAVEDSIKAYEALVGVMAAQKLSVGAMERQLEAQMAIDKIVEQENAIRDLMTAPFYDTESTNAGGIYADANEMDLKKLELQKSEYQTIVDETGEELDKLAKLQVEYQKNYGSLDKVGLGGGGGSGSESKLSDLKIDRYESEKQAIEDVNKELAKNQRLADSTEDEKKKNEYLQERIKLFKKMIDPGISPLTDLANKQRKEIEDTLELANLTFGIDFEYDKDINRLEFKNLQEVEDRIKSAFSVDVANDFIDRITKLVDRTRDLNKENQKLGDEYWANRKELRDALTEIIGLEKEYNKEITEKRIEANEKIVENSEWVEEQIQDMIEKGIDLRKEALDDELDDYEKYIDEKKRLLEDEFSESDYQKELKKALDEKKKIQNKINMLEFDNSLKARATRKDLTEELADIEEEIQEMQTNRSRDMQLQALDDLMDAKEEAVEKEDKLLDDKWTEEQKRISAREALISKSFSNLAGEFPELFDKLETETDGFFENFKSFQEKFIEGVGDMAYEFTNEILPKLQDATKYAKELNIIKDQIKKDEDEIKASEKKEEVPKKDPITQAKERIRSYQIEWNSLADLEKKLKNYQVLYQEGIATDSQIAALKDGRALEVVQSRMGELGQLASGVRSAFGLEREAYYDPNDSSVGIRSHSKGINAGLVTQTGKYLLHGSQSNPEWVLNNEQMHNLVKNLSNSGQTEIGSGAGTGDINLSITVNGDADAGVISGITSAGENIISDIKKIFNKNGVYA